MATLTPPTAGPGLWGAPRVLTEGSEGVRILPPSLFSPFPPPKKTLGTKRGGGPWPLGFLPLCHSGPFCPASRQRDIGAAAGTSPVRSSFRRAVQESHPWDRRQEMPFPSPSSLSVFSHISRSFQIPGRRIRVVPGGAAARTPTLHVCAHKRGRKQPGGGGLSPSGG